MWPSILSKPSSVAGAALTSALVLASAASSTPAIAAAWGGGAQNLPVTPALRAAVRASFYDRYRSDPDARRDYGAPRGRPESAVIGPAISHAGIVLTGSASTESTWVVASICIGSPVACQDAGAFQVFDRVGQGNPFVDRGFEPCSIPATLASRWFPGGRYPLGTTCPGRGR
jgi:hypothetical protein